MGSAPSPSFIFFSTRINFERRYHQIKCNKMWGLTYIWGRATGSTLEPPVVCRNPHTDWLDSTAKHFTCTIFVALTSRVFKISVRTGDVPWVSRPEGVGCGRDGWAICPKNHYCSQNDKFECILTQFFNRQKTRTVKANWDRFYGSVS